MKILKIFGFFVLLLLAIVIILLLALKINHVYQLKKEANLDPAPGKLVDINGKKIHVFAEGKGDLKLVFMAGHGTSNPTLDFKPLWKRLVNDYRIAVVEKSGYGWSETSNTPRDLDTMLEETRTALQKAGEQTPYVLMPHSMSGLEAIYWAQKYPDEIKAIIGLDPLIPETYKVIPKPEKNQLFPMFLISRLGVSRLMPESDIVRNLPLMASDDLTDEDKQSFLAVFYKSSVTKDMLNEVDHLSENVELVSNYDFPIDTPMYFFISLTRDKTISGWRDGLSDYISILKTGKKMELDADHYLHYEKAEIIAKETKVFLDHIK